jgi:hypothetical protein
LCGEYKRVDDDGTCVEDEIASIWATVLGEALAASSVVVEVVVVDIATLVVLVTAGAGVAEGGELRSSPLVAAVVDVEARVTSS